MYERFYQETKRTYDTHSKVISEAAKSAHITYLPKFIKQLPPAGFVIDLGCGTGRDARLFIEHGLAYLGVDFSLKMVEIAKKNCPFAQFEHKDIRVLNILPETVEAFWAPDVLYHLSKEDFQVFMKKAFKWLKPGGQFFLIMRIGTGEGYVPVPQSGGMYMAYYNKEELENITKSIGYKLVESTIVQRETVQLDSQKAYGKEAILVLWLQK
jgi:SAM-dependent methyltransferase